MGEFFPGQVVEFRSEVDGQVTVGVVLTNEEYGLSSSDRLQRNIWTPVRILESNKYPAGSVNAYSQGISATLTLIAGMLCAQCDNWVAQLDDYLCETCRSPDGLSD